VEPIQEKEIERDYEQVSQIYVPKGQNRFIPKKAKQSGRRKGEMNGIFIRSQNRRAIVNAIFVGASNVSKGDGCRIYADGSTFEDYVLATYATQERAIEVIDELQKFLNSHTVLLVYEMPKE